MIDLSNIIRTYEAKMDKETATAHARIDSLDPNLNLYKIQINGYDYEVFAENQLKACNKAMNLITKGELNYQDNTQMTAVDSTGSIYVIQNVKGVA